ncbi:rhamnulokinase [Alkalihalobacillus pseudalcaliphilus]|uniref:rhamnulokinase n=1 Tax=Alkalihalobacillus pseudalcaliphilus TaxID=79884 RepID=UPI00064DE5A5|nr:rhamnulokinase [Alkalihalobacillus pseudalcaliphilus]KMK75079.1 rhamnulokinase [Alkalihalobacillus pseudalcaliphilus]
MYAHRLAVDIGASSGRVMAGRIEQGKINLMQVHRFENKLIEKNGQFCWDIEKLFNEIKKGIQISVKNGLNPISIGINTWAVDFVLLDQDKNLLTEAVSYRDPRTKGMMEKVIAQLGEENLYERTGIAFQPFNTIYQLLAIKAKQPEILEKTKYFLMLPDYFHYLLTGKLVNEYTNASTTQLLDVFTKEWDQSLLKQLELPSEIFQSLHKPGTNMGFVTKEIEEELGVRLEVILPATHDTASAVAALPESKSSIYISSGTWSLIGIENHFPLCVRPALEANFTNEGGVDGRFRFLKNIMGLWMIQEVKRLLDERWTFEELANASKWSNYSGVINVNDSRFLKPNNMITEIRSACKEAGFPEPIEPADLTRCIYLSLIESYKEAIKEIEAIVDQPYSSIQIIGGGSANLELNQLLANQINRIVSTGPTEATAIGNYIVQAMATGEIASLSEARKLIKQSFEIHYYQPKGSGTYVNEV